MTATMRRRLRALERLSVIRRRTSDPPEPLSRQVESRLSRRPKLASEAAISEVVISTGSTLLDLAISGGRYPEGGIPGGILVEVFGPSGCGKTVLLCELAGAVQRGGGEVMFRDPEGRLNAKFAGLFGFEVANVDYGMTNTVVELFEPIRSWKPNGGGINAIFADSLAALSTEMEMVGSDEYGMRRAKEFSQECRLTCRVLAERNLLMVCSNQVRQNVDGGKFAPKFKSPGGEAIPFYASLRLRCHSPISIPREIKHDGKKYKRVVGVHTKFEVEKSSIDAPKRSADVYIMFDYGIDDIRGNLMFVKSVVGGTFYMLSESERLSSSLEESIRMTERSGWDVDLKRYAIQLWNELEEKFRIERRPKVRI